MGKKKGPLHGIWGNQGRPTAPINKEEFEKLCAISPTILECCAMFRVDDHTLNNWVKRNYNGKTFSEVLPMFGATGKISLRRKIWNLALGEASEEFAIKMLANKHLGMSTSQPNNLAISQTENNEEQTKELKVTWVVGDSEGKDYFDK